MKKWFYSMFQKNKEVKIPKRIISLQFDWESFFNGKELI